MRVLMIGGTALVGPHVIRELLTEPDVDIWTLTRTGRSYFCETALSGERDDEAALAGAFQTATPDVVIDMIPFTKANATHLTNAARRLVRPPRLVALSSIDVYQAMGRLNQTEDGPYQAAPILEAAALRVKPGVRGEAYDKIAVEQIYSGAFEDVTILRLPATYGWPDTTRVAPYLDAMLEGKPAITLPEDEAAFRFSRCLHKNAAFAVALAARSKVKGARVYNVAEPAGSETEWIARIAAACGWRGEVVLTPWTEGAENPRQHLEVSTEAIRRELGFFEKYDIHEGLSDTVAFHAYLRLGKVYEKYY